MQAWKKNRIIPETEEEGLTGYVKAKDASAYEERFARALERDPRVEGYEFQKSFYAPAGVAGEVQLDFMVYAGLRYPIQIDGDWVHKSPAARSRDSESDAKINEVLAASAELVQRVKGHEIEDQEATNRLVEEMF